MIDSRILTILTKEGPSCHLDYSKTCLSNAMFVSDWLKLLKVQVHRFCVLVQLMYAESFTRNRDFILKGIETWLQCVTLVFDWLKVYNLHLSEEK